MKEDIKYPYIGESKLVGQKVLFHADSEGIYLDGENYEIGNNRKNWNEIAFNNITRDHLAGTYGKINSSRHGVFIRLMCEKHGITVNEYPSQLDSYFAVYGNELLFFHNGESASGLGGKQITIPMPPKEVEVGEWPKANCEFQHKESKKKGVILCVDGSFAWCKYPCMNPVTISISDIQKPKTPEEELRDDITQLIDDAAKLESKVLARALIAKYNITKKQ